MARRRVLFDEFEVLIPKGHRQIVDKDETTDYLFVNAPDESYTVYFDSGMPMYEQSILNGCAESSMMELKLSDRKINFYCLSKFGYRKKALWYFNIEFSGERETLILPGQIMMHSDEVYRKTPNGMLPFIEILEGIKLKLQENCVASAN